MLIIPKHDTCPKSTNDRRTNMHTVFFCILDYFSWPRISISYVESWCKDASKCV